MHKQTRFAVLCTALVLVGSALLVAQQVVSPGVHPISGRRYAQTMSYLGADWLDRSERVQEEEPDVALDAIKLAVGSTVADVGAGSGYMTVRMARRVGPSGKVYANDIQPQMLSMLRQRLDREKLANVDLVLGTFDDPRLPANTLDLILMVDVYHEFSQPQAMLRRMRESLKTGARLVLLEYRKEDPSIPIRPDHKMSVAEAKMEVEAEGFTLASVDERLPRQHILVFTKN
ncbi:MAG TPA: class I SAM-dependent methyltransferase [Vicinamibacterales bacterium]|nr:class I SAM-dependent methyltransferase [Vicinamibacterales bacterium]